MKIADEYLYHILVYYTVWCVTMANRRELLAGGIAASTTALAGCTFDFEFGTGDPDNDDNGDDNDENQTFAIDEMRFTTERAQAFGDYDE